eukprot:g26779.t1
MSSLAKAKAFCDQFALRCPVLMAPMAGASPVALAAAVTDGGGMAACGVLGMSPSVIAEWSSSFRAQSGPTAPLQLNTWIPDPPALRDPQKERKMRDFLQRFGPEVPEAAGDAKVVDFEAQVAAMIEAIEAEAAGADAIVAQGMEAAAAAFVLGASAVQIGTGLLRCPEAGISRVWADALGQSRPEDTAATRAFSGRLGRSMKTAYVDKDSVLSTKRSRCEEGCGRPINVFDTILRRPWGFREESGEISWDPSRYHRSTRRMVYDFLHPGEEELLRFYSLRFCRLADAHLWLLPVLIGVNLLQVLILLMVLHWNLDYDFWELRILVLVLTATLFTAEVLLRVWACVEEHPALALQPNLSLASLQLFGCRCLFASSAFASASSGIGSKAIEQPGCGNQWSSLGLRLDGHPAPRGEPHGSVLQVGLAHLHGQRWCDALALP